jgi:hypothetical protein
MPVAAPKRWTSRSLIHMFLPELFRSPKHIQESTGVRKEKVPVDADEIIYRCRKRNEKMEKGIILDYRLKIGAQGQPKRSLWSVATGEWVPQHRVKFGTIFPLDLGSVVAREVSSRISPRAIDNGMMFPQPVWAAFNKVRVAFVFF